MSKRPRIAIAGLQHETNTFAPFGATFHDFEIADGWPELTRGADVLKVFPRLNIPIGGFISAAGGADLVPIAWAAAEPCAHVSDDAFDRLSEIVCGGIEAAGAIDGIYLDLHGAMVTDSHQDGEGELLRRLRARVGANMPIVISLDMHANVTKAMSELCDGMTIYRTYPHIDMADTGKRAYDLLLARIRAGRPLHRAFRKLPFLIPVCAQSTMAEPCKGLYDSIPALESSAVSNVDFAVGFPPADIHDCGPAIVAAGPDAQAVEAAADRLLAAVSAREREFLADMLTPADAVRRAIRAGKPGRPVILADVQDNPGGGGTSDTVGILAALVQQKAQNAALALLWDPAAAEAAHRAGVGAELDLALGGRYGYDPSPFQGRFRVEEISDGTVTGSGAMAGGVTMHLGPSARLKVIDSGADVTVVICSHRFQCLDLELFRGFGVEPERQAILAVKSTNHFRAAFQPIASEVLLVESPGANICRLDKIPFKNLRPDVRVAAASAS
jgi:microcystin degradation protein MlrC